MADQDVPLIILKAKRLFLESVRLLALKGNLQLRREGQAWVFTITVRDPPAGEDPGGSFRAMKKEAQKARG